MNIRKGPENLEGNINNIPKELANPEKENKAGKLSDTSGIREITIGQITGAQLDVLKNTLPKKITLSKNSENNSDNTITPLNGKLGNNNPFGFYKMDTNNNNSKQIIGAGVYSGKAIGKVGVGLIKGAITLLPDTYKLITGKATYSTPTPPEDFYT